MKTFSYFFFMVMTVIAGVAAVAVFLGYLHHIFTCMVAFVLATIFWFEFVELKNKENGN